jgi:signal transduction histidine kinase
MFQQFINWKTLFAVVGISIAASTILYSNYLSNKIKHEEKQKVEAWVEAQKTILLATEKTNLNLATKIATENDDIPIIETNENDSITGNYINLDKENIKISTSYLQKKLIEFKKQNKPVIVVLTEQPYTANKYYYGESNLQKEVRYYPIIQLLIIGLFVIVILFTLKSNFESSQNQLWAGMAKETAHQLGTPVSSLEGWSEILKDNYPSDKIIPEINKDIYRLKLITDRFGKIGSAPQLQKTNIIELLNNMIEYIKKRSGQKVQFSLVSHISSNYEINLSPTLFDWVIENLLKNALDAMKGQGKIMCTLTDDANHLIIDIQDSGAGIIQPHLKKIFNPGFTTKKRGWGLGLTLSKRIIEQYHKGKIFILSTEVNVGTTFRILLPK